MHKPILISGIFFALCIGGCFALHDNLRWGIMGGMLGGIVFSSLIACFLIIENKKFQKDKFLQENEQLLKEDRANRFVHQESLGGRIYLTDKRILFKPHPFNIQKKEFSVSLSAVGDIKVYKAFGFIPTGLLMIIDGKKEIFVMGNRQQWINEIKEARSSFEK